MTNTDTEQFEGVKLICDSGDYVNDDMSSKTRDRLCVADENKNPRYVICWLNDGFYQEGEEIARRWNAFPVLRKEMNELADKLLVMDRDNDQLSELKGSFEWTGRENQRLKDQLIRKMEEITRLREENERLKSKLSYKQRKAGIDV